MFYSKNVPTLERVVRVIMGMMGLAYAAMNWGVSGLAVGMGVMGAMLAMTGSWLASAPCAQWLAASSTRHGNDGRRDRPLRT